MEWTEGRKLASITYNNKETAFEYNHEGLRIKKTLSDGSYILYDIVDGVYVGETRYNASGSVAVYIRYILDAGNAPVGISLWYPATGGWTDYHFIKNLQGDILEVYKVSDKSLVASYTYDSWGNILSQSGDLATLNPFRYRSYYYDTQTWFYYLQSRYYDPAIGRFINADSFASTGQGIIGNNMFAYCNNSPIMLMDSGGSSATIAGGIIGGAFGFISAVISETSDDHKAGREGIRWDKVWKCTLSSAATGAAAGFVADVSIATCGAGTAIFISAAGGAICTGVNSIYTQHTLTENIDVGKVMSDALIGGVTNGLCTGTSNSLEPVAKGVKNGLLYAKSQVATELTPGFMNVGSFVLNDLIPTAITGFGGWYGGLAYDYVT